MQSHCSAFFSLPLSSVGTFRTYAFSRTLLKYDFFTEFNLRSSSNNSKVSFLLIEGDKVRRVADRGLSNAEFDDVR
jgi:hypothetical protein